MTQPDPFAPPSGSWTPDAAAPEPRAAPPLPPPGAALPPPTGAPISAAAFVGPPLPPPPARRRWLVPLVVGGAVALLALAVAVVFAALQLATSLRSDPVAVGSNDDPGVDARLDDLVPGDPGSPLAEEPLTCGECFRFADVQTLGLPDASYLRVGLGISDDALYRLAASEDQADQTQWWSDDGGSRDACYFTYPHAPLFYEPGIVDDLPARGDAVLYPAWHTDREEYYFFTEGIRVFDTTEAATAYLTRLPEAVAGCPEYALTETGWEAKVSPTAALDVPPSVASYGWVESDGYSRFFATDLQRGNVVVRVTLNTDADGPTETDFRDLVAEYSALLAELEPQP